MSITTLYGNTVEKLDNASQGLAILSPNLWLRLAVALVFFKSGLTKIANMQTTVFLFEHEYKVAARPDRGSLPGYLG